MLEILYLLLLIVVYSDFHQHGVVTWECGYFASCESASCESASSLYSDPDSDLHPFSKLHNFQLKIANVTTEVLNCISSKKTNIEPKLSRYTNENKQQLAPKKSISRMKFKLEK